MPSTNRREEPTKN